VFTVNDEQIYHSAHVKSIEPLHFVSYSGIRSVGGITLLLLLLVVVVVVVAVECGGCGSSGCDSSVGSSSGGGFGGGNSGFGGSISSSKFHNQD
jgi:hypothetical protein